MMQQRSKYIVAEVSRILLALTYLFSGFVKGIDPIGGGIKISEYLEVWGIGGGSTLSLVLSVALSSFEFALGALLLMGLRRRMTAWLGLLFMGSMTLLTLWLALFNPIGDCGCFGDAIKLTNWQTFGKNVILMLLTLSFFAWYRFISRTLYGYIAGVAVVLAVIGWGIFVMGNLRHLPLIDFRPYKIGVSLRDLTMIPENAPREEIEYLFIYEKDGVRQEFDMNALPDSTWTYIDRQERVISEGYTPPVMDFAIYAEGRDITQTLLLNKSPQIWVITPDWAQTPVQICSKLNNLYTWASSIGIPMYAISGSTKEEMGRWRNKTGARYPLYYCDAVTIKTIARAVPTILYISDAVIMDKFAARDLSSKRYRQDVADQLFFSFASVPTAPLHIDRWILLALWLLWTLVMLILRIRWEDDMRSEIPSTRCTNKSKQ